MTSFGFGVLAVFLAVMPGEASAFYHIWKFPKPPPVARSDDRLKGVREAGCGNPEFTIEKFGETAFMRGELDRGSISPEFQQALAAATIAEDGATAKVILEKYLANPDTNISSVANLQLARVILHSASNPRSVADEVRKLVSNVRLDRPEADTAYIEAVLAFYDGRDNDARNAARRALLVNRQFYNARILLTVLDLRQIDRELFPRLSCEQSVAALTEAIIPVLQLGACPIHVAHLDLTVRRFLGERSEQRSPEAAKIRDIILAYVSRNDRLRRHLLAEYEKTTPESRRCLAVLRTYDVGQAHE